jgi:hypothetical protein
VHKEVGKLTLNGDDSEGWSSTGANVFATTNGAITGSAYPPLALCRYATFNPVQSSVTGTLANGEFAVQYNNGNNSRLFFKNAAISDVSGFVAWVSENTPTIYYALATPTDTEITNAALIEQLENLLNLSRTYQGQTNLSSTYVSGNMPAILNVSYFTEQDPDTRDELIIDSRLHTVTLNGLDIYHLIGEGSEFLMLEPGENRLSLQSDITGDNGYAVVSYKQGYLSI